jgi:hypothetical protein
MNNPDDLTDFKRIIKDNDDEIQLHYKNLELKLYTKKVKTKFIDTIPKDGNKKLKILTLDFETRDVRTSHTNEDVKIVGKKVPVSISIYDGKKCYSCVFQDVNT